MPYGDINEVRTYASVRPIFSQKQVLQKGNALRTEFRVPNVGANVGYFLDLESGIASIITIADVVVYVAGIVVTVSSIDQDAGTVTLAAAPANNEVVQIDYMYSEVSDAQCINAMNKSEEIIDDMIRGANVAGKSYTQTIDGDGETREFVFDHHDVTAIDVVTVDGTVLTVGTDYWIYFHKKSNIFYHKIKFLVRPSSATYQNVTLAYTYGQETDLGNNLSNLVAARTLLLGHVKGNRTAGKPQGGSASKSKDAENINKIGRLNREITEIFVVMDRKIRHTKG